MSQHLPFGLLALPTLPLVPPPPRFATRFRSALPADMHRLRLDVAAADKERGRLEGRLAAREREIGVLTNKAKAASEQHKEELRAAKKDADELQKKVGRAQHGSRGAALWAGSKA